MTIIEESDLGAVGKDLLENLKEIKESVSEIKKAQFKKESTFEDTQHLQEYVGDTINMIKNNLTKLQEK
jgi:septation ring formation regulator EzrA